MVKYRLRDWETCMNKDSRPDSSDLVVKKAYVAPKLDGVWWVA